MPKFLDIHALGNYSEDDLKKAKQLPPDEFGVKVLNIFYNMETDISFCFIDAPNREAVRSIMKNIISHVTGLPNKIQLPDTQQKCRRYNKMRN